MNSKTVTPAEFVASMSFDGRLAPYDLTASIAHVDMLARQKIIPARDGAKIRAGLKRLQVRCERGGRLQEAEDVHFAIEKSLYKEIGPVAGKMHTARSRNDQTATAFRLYLRDHIDGIDRRLVQLIQAFLRQAQAHPTVLMPGYTHLQPGQPILAAHHLLAYGWMFQRDRDRLADGRRRVNRLPLGAAALAGTPFPIDRNQVARRLGFDGVIENSIDAVSDRDFLVEFLAAASLVMTHLSRFAEELILWTNPSFGFVRLAEDFTTGSSIMPQKRNPDMAELLRGKTGRVFGGLTALLTLLKGTPLAYNRDFQEDKPPVFDAVDTLEACLDVTIPMVETMKINASRMRAACRLGFILATDVADGLARRGMPFREAHGVVARAVAYAVEREISLEEVPLSLWRQWAPQAGPWIAEVLDLQKAVAARTSLGGTAPTEVKRQMAQLRRRVAPKVRWVAGILFGVAAMFSFPKVRAEDADRVLTLDQSVQTALQNSQSLLSARDGVRIAQQRIVEARALYLPTLALNMNASRYRAEDSVTLPPEFGGTVLSRLDESGDFYASRLSLRQVIYNGGRNRTNVRLAEAALAQARIREESVRGQVTVDAVSAFFDVLLAKKQLALADEARADVLAMVPPARGPDDGSRATLVSLTARLRREQAERCRKLDRHTRFFLAAVGLELYTKVAWEGVLETVPVRESLAKLLARAQEARLEIRGTEYQREIDRLAVYLSESQRTPVVIFGAAYELNNAAFPLDRAFWNATLNVNLPLFDGFASRARIRQSRLIANQNRIARASVEDRINREVRESYADVAFWQSEMENRKNDWDRMDELIQRISTRSAVERASLRLELLAVTEAYWESVHGHRVARAQLEKAVGLPLVP